MDPFYAFLSGQLTWSKNFAFANGGGGYISGTPLPPCLRKSLQNWRDDDADCEGVYAVEHVMIRKSWLCFDEYTACKL